LRVTWELSAKMPRKSRARTVALPLSPPLARPGMLVYLVDAANLITLGGLAISLFACWAVLSGRPSLALALAALAVVIDNVDGWVARRTVGRNPALEPFGAHFDCYADYLSKGIFPVLYLYNRHRFGLKAKPLASLLFPIISMLPRKHFIEQTVVGFLLVLVVCFNRFFKSGNKPLHFPDIINFARKSSFSYG